MTNGRPCSRKGVFLALALMIARTGVSREEPPSLDQVRLEYPAALARLEAAYGQLRGKGVLTTTTQEGTPSERVIRSNPSFALDGPRQKYERTFTDRSPDRTSTVREVLCRTPELAFKLVRKSDDAPYSLAGLTDAPRSDDASAIDSVVRDFVNAPFSIPTLRLSELMAEPEFSFTGATRVDQGGVELIRIEFDCPKSKSIFRAGSIVVSPGQGWVIHELDCYTSPKRNRVFTRNIEYDDPVDGLWLPRRVDYREPSGIHQVFEFESISPGATPEREFELSHYGLPDLGETGRDAAGASGFYWLLAVAAVALGAALTLRQVASRMRRGQG